MIILFFCGYHHIHDSTDLQLKVLLVLFRQCQAGTPTGIYLGRHRLTSIRHRQIQTPSGDLNGEECFTRQRHTLHPLMLRIRRRQIRAFFQGRSCPMSRNGHVSRELKPFVRHLPIRNDGVFVIRPGGRCMRRMLTRRQISQCISGLTQYG